jgi:TonB family protein
LLLGPTLGEEPREIRQASAEAAFPLATITPPYPPRALGTGVVLVEAGVDGDGILGDVKVLRSAPPFDDAGQAAIRRWTFHPARLGRATVSTLVYVILGFRAPVV